MIKTFKSYIGILLFILLVPIILLLIKGKSFDTTKFNVKNEYNNILELTSSKYKGRLAGTEGNSKALKYIENYFKKIGVKPGGENGTYYQEFKSMVPIYNSKPYFEIKNSNGEIIKNYTIGKDYIENLDGYGGSGTAEGKLFYVKDMISNYKPEVLKGKIIITDTDIGDNDIEYAIDNGIKCIIRLAPDGLRKTSFYTEDKSGKTILLYLFKNESFYELLKYAKEDKYIDTKLDEQFKYVNTPNIIGKIQGKKRNSGYIIFSSHFDGFGEEPGSNIYYPGAKDGATGTSIILELARVIEQQKNKPDKTMIFALWNNEEFGMRGKNYYIQNPVYPLKSTTLLYINNIGGKYFSSFEFGYKGQASQILSNKIAQFTESYKEQNNPISIEEFAKNGAIAVSIQEIQLPIYSSVVDDSIINIGTTKDTINNLVFKQLSVTTNFLLNFIKKEIYSDVFGGLFNFNEKLILSIFLFLFVLIYLINIVNRNKPEFEIFNITIENIYYSSFYRIFERFINYLLQAGLILVLVVFVTHIPSNFNLFNLNGKIQTNFSWNKVIVSTIEYLRTLFTSGFGKTSTGTNVSEYMQYSFFKSFWLLASVLVFGTIFGTAKGVFDAFREDENKSDFRTIGTIMMFSLPDVFVVILIQLVFIYIYSHNILDIPREYREQKQFVEAFLSLILLPSIYITRIASIAVHEEMRKEYIKAAKAKGLSNFRIIKNHLLIGVLIKVIESLPSILSLVISNLIIVDFLSGYNSIVTTMLSCYNTGEINAYTGLALCLCFLYISFLLIFKAIDKFLNPLKRREI